MRPILFSIGPINVYGYGLMIAIGVICALLLLWKRCERIDINSDQMTTLVFLLLICGFAGAKLLYVIAHFKDFLASPLSTLGSEGFVVYGGIIVGILTVWLWCRKKERSFADTLDVIFPAVAVGQGFGRLGCFMAGCCYGLPTDSFLGITFPPGGGAPAGIPLWPVQLFSSAYDFLLFGFMLWQEKKHPKKGQNMLAYLYAYSVGRFLIEYLRNDTRGEVGPFSTSQFISILILIFAVLLTVRMRKSVTAPPDASSEETVSEEAAAGE